MPIDTSNKLKMHEGRKSSKPLMEKRRRARINDSLGQLKTLILEATNKDSSRHSKLEKADILEMTVKYLRNMQRQQMSAMNNDPNLMNRYRLGYSECITEVSRFLKSSSDSNVEVQTNLIGHLANCCSPQQSQGATPKQQQQQQPPVQQQQVAYAPTPAGQTAAVPTTVPATAAQSLQQQQQPPPQLQQPSAQLQVTVPCSSSAQPVPQTVAVNIPSQIQHAGLKPDNNVARVISGIPIGVPGSLPSGEITVVLPPQALPGGQLPSHFIPVYAQSTPLLSPPASSHSDSTTPSPMSSPSSSVSSPTQANNPPTVYQPASTRESQICFVPPNTNSTVLSPAPSPVTHGDARSSASSPVAGNVAPIMVQAPTLVTLPVPAPCTVFQTSQVQVTGNGQIVNQSPRGTVLRTINANIPHQPEHDSMWRPW